MGIDFKTFCGLSVAIYENRLTPELKANLEIFMQILYEHASHFLHKDFWSETAYMIIGERNVIVETYDRFPPKATEMMILKMELIQVYYVLIIIMIKRKIIHRLLL